MTNLFDIEDAWGSEMVSLSSGTGSLTRKQRAVGGRATRVASQLSKTKCIYRLVFSTRDIITSKILLGVYK